MAASRIDLSIIVVSYNTRALLQRCLESIGRTAGARPVEVVVVDNASRDGSVEMVETSFPQAVMIVNPVNVGFAKAVNQGLRVAQGAQLLLLNSDTELQPDATQHCLDFLRHHSDAGIVGCKLLNSDGSLQPSGESFPDLKAIFFESFFLEKMFPRSRLFGRQHLTYFRYDRVARVDYVKGAFLMIRRETVEDIGLLDEDFFFYAEEMDWCYRARQKGWEVYYTPHAEVVHHGGQSSDPISRQMFIQLHKNRFRFYRKHHGAMKSAMARGVLAIGALLRVCVWTMIVLHHQFLEKSELDFARRKVIAFRAAFLWYVGLARNRWKS